MECTFSREEILVNQKTSISLREEKTKIDMMALDAIENILRHCENNTLHFSDKEDDDENFTVNAEGENHLVDSVRMDKDGVIILNCNGREFCIWETDKTAVDVYPYMVDEIEFEFDHSDTEE